MTPSRPAETRKLTAGPDPDLGYVRVNDEGR